MTQSPPNPSSCPHSLRRLGVVLALVSFGCDAADQEKPEPEETTEADTDPAPEDPEDPSASSTTGEDPEETTGEPDTSDTEGECSFIGCDDDTIIEQCDIWQQDCPESEKCMPWANDGGNSWNATKCVPVDAQPGQPGDACQVEGSGVSGIDSCDVSAMCWNVNPETNEGTCVAFCSGSQATPVCDDPSTTCSILNEGALILCLPECNPLTQDCGDGEACYPGDQGFVCAPNASAEEQGNFGDPCEFVNVCNPSLLCVNAASVPGCAGSLGCCTEFCDLDEAQPSAACTGVSSGQECLPAFDEGSTPPEYANVGICLLPE